MKLPCKGKRHILLFGIVALALANSMTSFSQDLNSNLDIRPGTMNITPGDADALLQNGSGLVIIDIRTPQEYQSGHLEGALNIDYYSDEFLDTLKSLDRNSTYIIYCRRGIRGGAALGMMRDMGFKDVYNILGGLAQWAQDGRPMIGEVI